jgi:hypothetical protein
MLWRCLKLLAAFCLLYWFGPFLLGTSISFVRIALGG